MIKYAEVTPQAVQLPKLRRSQLGDLRPLHESMRKFGQMFPLVLSVDGVLLSGERRLLAATMGGHSEIAVAIVETLPEAAELMVQESDELRRPMPWSERARVCHDLMTVDIPALVNRRYEASQRRGLGRSEVDHVYPHLAAIFDSSVATIRRAMAVYRASLPGQPYAEQAGKLLHQIDITGKVSTYYNELIVLRGPNGEAPILDPTAPPKKVSAQKAQIAAVVTTVSGATRGLGMIESVESLPTAEVRRLCGEITRARQILRNLSQRLQEAKS